MAVTVGLNQGAIMQARMEEFLDACGQAGIPEVELRVPKLVEALYHMPPAELQERLSRNKITVTAVNSLDDFALVPDANLEMLRRETETAAQLCSVTGCDLIVAVVGRWFSAPRPPWKWIRETTVSRLQFIAAILEPRGIRIGLEPISFPEFTVGSIEQSVDILDASGVERAVLVADVYNLMLGNSTPRSLAEAASRIGIIHVNDAPQSEAKGLHVMYSREFPGEGILKPAEWVKAAIENGYQGPVSVEVFKKPIWDMNVEEAVRLCAGKARAFSGEL